MILLLLALGCHSGADDTGLPVIDGDPDCDPLVPEQCGMPFPSTYFMAQDDSTVSGWRVDFGPTTLPADIDGYQPDPHLWNEFDGFSPLSTLVVMLPDVSLDGVIGHQDLAAYLDDDARTVIIDAETGERVPHFVELDMTGDDDARRVLMLRPVQQLEYGKRYVVGIRGLVDSAGAPIPATDAMQALIADQPTGDARIDNRQDWYDSSIFPVLEGDGWQRDEVILAWDFVTASQDSLIGRSVMVRDDALDRVGDGGPPYVIDRVETDYENFAEVIHGKMTVPLYTDTEMPPTLLTRDEDGLPYYNGDLEVPFVVAIPPTLIEDPRPAPLVQYGHGFFGLRNEVYEDWADWNYNLAQDNGWIFYGVDWSGMAVEDRGYAALLIATQIEDFPMMPERTVQGFVEAACAARLMQGDFVEEPLMILPDAETGDDVHLIDPSRHWFYGVSQGGILGGAYVALSEDIQRAVFGVSGTPYTFMTTRSGDFDEFFILFETMYPDPADRTFWLSVLQTPWDQGDASGYLRTMNQDPLPGTTAKQVLMQIAIGDAQVSTLAGEIQARGYGAALIDTPAREVWGLDLQPDGWTGSALVEWDTGVEEPVENLPSADETDTHGVPRNSVAGQQQIATFFEDGQVVNYCDGVCDPE